MLYSCRRHPKRRHAHIPRVPRLGSWRQIMTGSQFSEVCCWFLVRSASFHVAPQKPLSCLRHSSRTFDCARLVPPIYPVIIQLRLHIHIDIWSTTIERCCSFKPHAHVSLDLRLHLRLCIAVWLVVLESSRWQRGIEIEPPWARADARSKAMKLVMLPS